MRRFLKAIRAAYIKAEIKLLEGELEELHRTQTVLPRYFDARRRQLYSAEARLREVERGKSIKASTSLSGLRNINK